MFVKSRRQGHVLLVVLVIVSLLSFFVNNIAQLIIVEYQRTRNQLLDQQLWRQLEFDVNAFIKTLGSNKTINADTDIIGFIADSLEFGCNTGINLRTFTAKNDKQPVQLIITYALRR